MKTKQKEDSSFITQQESIFKDRRNKSGYVTPSKERRQRQFSDSNEWYLRVDVTSQD